MKLENKSSGQAKWPSQGFPDALQYELEVEGHESVQLNLKWNRFLSVPERSRQLSGSKQNVRTI